MTTIKTNKTIIKLRKIRDLGVELKLPFHATEGSSGLDLSYYGLEPILLQPGVRILVPTGFSMELQSGYEAQLRPRSSLAYKHGITLANSPATIDSDYRGEVKVLMINLGDQDYLIAPGTRIAQMVISRYEQAEVVLVEELTDSVRGEGGFGSTGV